MSLRTLETAYNRDIELGSTEVTLYTLASGGPAVPSSILFAIPLPQDSPQTIHTPHSSLTHTLTATLHPSARTGTALVKTHAVHTRRYTSHAHTLAISPESRTLDAPANLSVEIPRSTFTSGEPIPIYVTVPTPPRSVVQQGLRLRNVRTELVRVVKVKQEDTEDDEIAELEIDKALDELPSFTSQGSSAVPPQPSSSKIPMSPLFPGSSYRTVLSRSGAQCRFHSGRPVKLRFILHQSSPSASPADGSTSLPSLSTPRGHTNSDADCPSITQLTVLHAVTFRLNIHISFVDMSTRTERISTITFPIHILAPPAPLPEIAASMDAAYQKKHDRPPVKTNRAEDGESSAPHYTEGQAGPSGLPPSGAPPPFEERDAPPPFFSSAAESSSSGLPTFLESEAEIIIPSQASIPSSQNSVPVIPGEGQQFGFLASEQFDGHSEDMQRSSTPPPTLEQATLDTDVTLLAEMSEPERSIEALGIVLDQEEAARGVLPPPPPALDDPSDPPPTIDSGDFRQTSPHPSPPLRPVYTVTESAPGSPPPSIPVIEEQTNHRHAPPPYLVPEESHGDQESVTRPPPYVD